MVIKFQGQEYEVSTTLRVAFIIQSKFNHKPYMQIFQDIQNMKLEEQVRMLFVAFDLKNPNVATEKQFLDEVLDNWNLNMITRKVAELVEAITFNGMSEEEIAEVKNQTAIQQAQM